MPLLMVSIRWITSLQGRSGIGDIHIISHGSSSSVALGDSIIDSAVLAAHAIQLETNGQSLTESGDILVSRRFD